MALRKASPNTIRCGVESEKLLALVTKQGRQTTDIEVMQARRHNQTRIIPREEHASPPLTTTMTCNAGMRTDAARNSAFAKPTGAAAAPPPLDGGIAGELMLVDSRTIRVGGIPTASLPALARNARRSV
jgi:hypothetical protein